MGFPEYPPSIAQRHNARVAVCGQTAGRPRIAQPILPGGRSDSAAFFRDKGRWELPLRNDSAILSAWTLFPARTSHRILEEEALPVAACNAERREKNRFGLPAAFHE